MRLTADERTTALELLRSLRRADFGDYRPELVDRTFQEHFVRSQCADAAAWLSRLRQGGRPLDDLVEALGVSVTSFFRDVAAFEDLERVVVPEILQAFTLGTTFRVWVIGTATGQEAWSLAMVLATACDPLPWEIIGTDIDKAALGIATLGEYRDVGSVPPRFAERYLEPTKDGSWRIGHQLRRNVRFVEHRFMGPQLAPVQAIVPAFQLISCRNVMLHFDERLRQKAWERIGGVVLPYGAIFVGSVEAPPDGAPVLRWPRIKRSSALFRPRSAA